MATQVQFRGGTTSEHSSFNGVAKEVTVDTTKQTLVVQDGSTNGGFPLLREKNPDSQKVYFGTGDDLQIYHNGSHNYVYGSTSGQNISIIAQSGYINLQPVNNAEGIIVKNNGAVELYYDNQKKLETTSDGVKLPDGHSLTLGDGGDVKLKHQSTHFEINNTSGNSYFQSNGAFHLRCKDSGTTETMLVGNVGGSVDLYYDNSKKLETSSTGGILRGTLWTAVDNCKIAFGSGDDLKIYHDGSNSYILNTTGELQLRDESRIKLRTDQFVLNNFANDESIIYAAANGAVELYYNNHKSFNTSLTGISIYGTEGGEGCIHMYADQGDDNADYWRLTAGTDTTWYLQNYAAGSYETNIKANGNGNVELYYDNSKKLETTSTGILAQTSNPSTTESNADTLIVRNTNNGASTYAGIRLEASSVASTDFYIAAKKHSSGNGTNLHIGQGTTERLQIAESGAATFAGTVTCTSLTETSDIALKTNIEPITNVLDKINQITGYKYDFTQSNSSSMGVIAQDVEKVFPELVHGSEGSKSLQYSGLIGALIESVKELSAKVAALEAG